MTSRSAEFEDAVRFLSDSSGSVPERLVYSGV